MLHAAVHSGGPPETPFDAALPGSRPVEDAASRAAHRPPTPAAGAALAGASLALTVPGLCCTLPRALLAARS